MIISIRDIEEMIKEHLTEEQYDVVCDLANFYNSRKDKIKSVTFGYRRPWTHCFVSFRFEDRYRNVLFGFNADLVSRNFEECFLYKIHKNPKTKLFPDDKTQIPGNEFTEFPDNEEF